MKDDIMHAIMHYNMRDSTHVTILLGADGPT